MCGIVGTVCADPVDVETVRSMLSALKHRGPDGSGLITANGGRAVLGHSRLAIIDLSETGRQPMCYEAHDLWLTFNGEIYNYRELRRTLEARGHRFRSTSDTEVILHGYREWSDEVVRRLDGIFAFGLWDGTRRRLLLARDQVGVKPLYYMEHDDGRGLSFASEPRALLRLRRCPPSVHALHDYLTFGYLPRDRSAYAGVRKLLPAHVVIWGEGKPIQPTRYWQPPDAIATKHDENELAVDLLRYVEQAVLNQLVSDVPVGVVVSGGVDSSVVATTMARSGMVHDAFTIGYPRPEQDERPYARTICEHIGFPLHESELGDSSIVGLLHQFFETYDEPFADSSGLPTLFLFSQVAAAHRKVVLSGDGGDELFAGYRRYRRLVEVGGYSQRRWPWRALYAQDLRHASKLLRSVRTGRTSSWDIYFGRIRRFDFAQQCAILSPAWRPGASEDLEWVRDACWRTDVPAIRAAQQFDFETYLPDDVLTKVDRASMAHGVEARVPLLDGTIVTMALSTPSHLHLRGGITKRLFKRAVADIVPRKLLSNRKKGFGLPTAQILGRLLVEWARAGETASRLARDGVIDPARLAAVEAWNHDQRWTLFCLEMWWRRWVHDDKQATSSICTELGTTDLASAAASQGQPACA